MTKGKNEIRVTVMEKTFSFLLSLFAFLFFATNAFATTVGPRAYIVNNNSNNVTVLDSGTNSVITTIPVGVSPEGIAISPDGSKLYVSNFSCCTPGQGSISVIDTSNYQVIATIPVGDNPLQPAVSASGTYLYVPNYYDDYVSVIDTSTNTVVNNITVGLSPNYIVTNATNAYVSFSGTNYIAVIDTTTNLVTNQIEIGAIVGALSLSPNGSTLYVSDSSNDRIRVVDTASNTITGNIPVTGGVLISAVNSAGNRLYVTNFVAQTLTVVDTINNSVIAVIPFPDIQGQNINGVAVSPDDSSVYVTKSRTGETLAVIDASTNTVSTNLQIGAEGSVLIVFERPPTPQPQLSSLSPAKVWIGLKNSDDVGTKFDLKAEAYRDGMLISTGQLNSFTGGSSGFANAHLATIPFDPFSPFVVPSGTELKIQVLVRNACTGSAHNSGTARFWYNDSAANSSFGATINQNLNTYYLVNGFNLSSSVGSGPKKTVDVAAGAKCSAFKTFGTWTTTL